MSLAMKAIFEAQVFYIYKKLSRVDSYVIFVLLQL